MRSPRRDFQNQQCLITGAASGIGRATALAVAERGGHVVLTDLQRPGLERTAAEIAGSGGVVLDAIAADLTSHEEVGALASRTHRAHGSMDVVMNIAGAAIFGPVERLEHEHWRRMIDVNLMGPVHVIEAFLPAMVRAGRGGHLVNVASAAGLIALPWHAAYSASKFGLRGISEVLRFDLRPHGIGVTLVCPGAVATPLVDTVDIVGLDRGNPTVRKMTAQFRRRAQSPEAVADIIAEAVERGRYLVFTSPDIRLAFWVQRFVPPLYEAAMRALNRRMTALARRAQLPDRVTIP